jgi:hypothetical protein
LGAGSPDPPDALDAPNPHQALDEKRFISDSAIAFARVQADAIRAHDQTHPITTNGLFGHLDSHRLTDELLDFFSYDSYPQFAALWPDSGEDALLDRRWGMNLSVTRDISPNFCVMEQQAGPGGWVNRIEQPSPKPGQMRLWTYQSIAHGADAVLYFRWRTAPFGTEIYWHGINDYHNQPNRRCHEATQVGRELAAIGDEIVGSRYAAEVALVKDYDNEWDGELDTWHGPYERQSLLAWYKALQHAPRSHRHRVSAPRRDDGRRPCTLSLPRVPAPDHPAGRNGGPAQGVRSAGRHHRLRLPDRLQGRERPLPHAPIPRSRCRSVRRDGRGLYTHRAARAPTDPRLAKPGTGGVARHRSVQRHFARRV